MSGEVCAVSSESENFGFVRIFYKHQQEDNMNKIFTVPNISCGHCVSTIENELSLVEGVELVQANQNTKQVNVQVTEPEILGVVESVLAEIGYPVGDLGAKPSITLS
jgi:copper chaperone